MRRKIKARVLDNTQNFIMKLSQESEDGALVVVEGPNDVQALRSLGFKGKSHMLCWNAGLSRLPAEMILHTKVIPLLNLGYRTICYRHYLSPEEHIYPHSNFFCCAYDFFG